MVVLADRSIKVVLRANVTDFKQNITLASKSLNDLVKEADKTGKVSQTSLGRMTQSMQLQRESWDRAGSAIMAVGVGSAAALGGATKAAADWESAFAGVRKTVEGSEKDYASLNKELRAMARELPSSHEQIAAVAEAAGQLGIQKENITSFTRTMIDMGEATNLSADEAATTLARFANIMGTSQSEFSNLGSAIVALGNNFATTESEIAAMGMRLAGAGRQLGMSEGDIFGISTALSSVGVEAEAGGSAFSKFMIDMKTSVDTGNDKLAQFAEVAGMTSDEFTKLFHKDAGAAITAFIQGLGGLEKQGKSAIPVLEALGFKEVRLRDALLRSSSAADMFAGAMELGNKAYKENNALADEAAQRYKTAESQWKIFKNSIRDIGISIGATLLPALTMLLKPLNLFAGFIASMPAPLRVLNSAVLALASGVGIVGGGFMLLAPRILETYKAFQALKALNLGADARAMVASLTEGSRGAQMLAASLGKVGVAAKALTAGGILVGSIKTGVNMADALNKNLTHTKDLLESVGSWTPQNTFDQLFGNFSDRIQKDVGDLESAFDRLANKSLGDILGSGFNARSSGHIDTLTNIKRQVEELDAAFEALDGESAARAFATVWKAAGGTKQSLENMLETMPTLEERMTGLAQAAGYSADAAGVYQYAISDAFQAQFDLADSAGTAAEGLGTVGDAADNTTRSLEDYLDAMAQAAAINISADEALMKYAETLEDMANKIHAGAGAAVEGTQAQRENQKALIALAKDSADVTQKLYEQTGASQELVAKTKLMADNFIHAANQAGVMGDAAVALAADYGLIPPEVRTVADFDTWKAELSADNLKAKLDENDNRVTHSTHEHREVTIFERIFGQSPSRKEGSLLYMPGKAKGGMIQGPGTGTSDSVPIWASNGEYIMKAAAVRHYGRDLFDQLNAKKYRDGGLVGNYQPVSKIWAPPTGGGSMGGLSVHIGAINNPQTEPGSTTLSKELQRAAVLAGGLA